MDSNREGIHKKKKEWEKFLAGGKLVWNKGKKKGAYSHLRGSKGPSLEKLVQKILFRLRERPRPKGGESCLAFMRETF